MTDSEKTTSRFRTVDLAYIALFAVLMAVCAWITIPIPKPFVQFTLQTFAVFMALITLGGRRGLDVTVVYLLMGAVGVPVFSGFRGAVASARGCWLVTSGLGESLPVVIAACGLGLVLCYAFGTAWFMVVYAQNSGPVGLMTALGWCVFPYIIPDLVKLALAVLLSRRVKKFLK